MSFTFQGKLDKKKAQDLRTIEELMGKAQSSYKPKSQGAMTLDTILNIAKLAKGNPTIQAFGYGGDILTKLIDKRKFNMPDIPQHLMFGQQNVEDMKNKIQKMNDMIQKKKNMEVLKTLGEFGFSELAEPGKEWLQGKFAKPIAKGKNMLSEMTQDTMLGSAADDLTKKLSMKFPSLFKGGARKPYTNVKYQEGQDLFKYTPTYLRKGE